MVKTPSASAEDPGLIPRSRRAPSRILAWRIPWTEGPGGLQSMGSQRDLAAKQQHNSKSSGKAPSSRERMCGEVSFKWLERKERVPDLQPVSGQ